MESRDRQILDLAMEAGKTLLDAGAEIFRAEAIFIGLKLLRSEINRIFVR